jgi:predicted nucleic acid-binding protein
MLAAERARLHTTNFVVAEAHALILRRIGRNVARRFVNELRTGVLTVVRVSELDEEHAVAIINRNDDKDFSYVDATSFAVMERLGIDEGFSFDRHFRQYGRRMLPEQLA